MEVKVLTVTAYAEKEEDNKRVTIQPMNVAMLAADIEDSTIQNRSLRKVAVLLLDGETIELFVNHQDLETMEQAVGSYLVEG